jgi:hypothetical protein
MLADRSDFCRRVDKSVTRRPFTARLWSAAARHPLVSILAAGVCVVQAVATATGGPAPSIAIRANPFAAIAAASVLWRYIVEDRDRVRRKWIMSAAALATATALSTGRARGRLMPLPLLDMLIAQGIVGAIGFIVACRRAPTRPERQRWIDGLLTACILPLSASMVSFGLWSSSRLNPVYDGHVLLFERQLGVSFSLVGVWSYHLAPAVSRLATVCYDTVAIGLVLAAAKQGSVRRELDVLTATVAAGLVGFALYFVCPVVGPLHAFRPPYPMSLPNLSRSAALVTAATGPPRNGMPSLHTVWALLIWFNAGPLPHVWRRALRLFAALTIWAAMGLDDTHWMTDLVVAVPLAVALQAAYVERPSAAKHQTLVIVSCAALVAAWLASIRLAWIVDLPSPLAWAAVASTIAWPLRCVASATARGANGPAGTLPNTGPALAPARELEPVA